MNYNIVCEIEFFIFKLIKNQILYGYKHKINGSQEIIFTIARTRSEYTTKSRGIVRARNFSCDIEIDIARALAFIHASACTRDQNMLKAVEAKDYHRVLALLGAMSDNEVDQYERSGRTLLKKVAHRRGND
ncbi:MAG: hypothetical protein ACLFVO_09510 [Chloroflexaceae bacterium]